MFAHQWPAGRPSPIDAGRVACAAGVLITRISYDADTASYWHADDTLCRHDRPELPGYPALQPAQGGTR